MRPHELEILSRARQHLVELLIDHFDMTGEGKAYLRSPAFAKNETRIEFTPDALVARFCSGTSIKELVLVE